MIGVPGSIRSNQRPPLGEVHLSASMTSLAFGISAPWLSLGRHSCLALALAKLLKLHGPVDRRPQVFHPNLPADLHHQWSRSHCSMDALFMVTNPQHTHRCLPVLVLSQEASPTTTAGRPAKTVVLSPRGTGILRCLSDFCDELCSQDDAL